MVDSRRRRFCHTQHPLLVLLPLLELVIIVGVGVGVGVVLLLLVLLLSILIFIVLLLIVKEDGCFGSVGAVALLRGPLRVAPSRGTHAAYVGCLQNLWEGRPCEVREGAKRSAFFPQVKSVQTEKLSAVDGKGIAHFSSGRR